MILNNYRHNVFVMCYKKWNGAKPREIKLKKCIIKKVKQTQTFPFINSIIYATSLKNKSKYTLILWLLLETRNKTLPSCD